ncbi:MAG: membrane protein insertase YidC [Candidatus Harrisonbacteria bacterium]|nr:membrane protein insertase YidC [Candidatus Harrisonbacteria bacterium]
MSSLFHTFLYQPLFNTLVFFYNTIAFQDLGVAIILLTITIRFLLFPLFYKGFKNQTIMQKIQPELRKIQHEHKENKERQAQAMMDLYRQHNINPFSSFFLLFLQLPILIALYQVFLKGFADVALADLYGFVANPGHLNVLSLGLIDLGKRSILIVVLAAIAQYYQGRLSLPADRQGLPKQDGAANDVARKMVYVGPVLTVVVLTALPSAVGLYWLTASAFSLVQQIYINRVIYGDNSRDNEKTA